MKKQNNNSLNLANLPPKELIPYKLGSSLSENHCTIEISPPPLEYHNDGYVTPDCRNKLLNYHPEIALISPQIPPNTGSIARLCAAFSCRLHLIEPLGFQITEKSLRRAGLDYWEFVEIYLHTSFSEFCRVRKDRRFVMIETGGTQTLSDFQFQPGDILLFGSETKGIPEDYIFYAETHHSGHKLSIPMYNMGVRSINLANAVSIAVYCAIDSLH